MNARKEMGLVPTDAAILGYKNTFGGDGGGAGGGIIEENLEAFKAQIDMEILGDWGEYVGAFGKYEFLYEDEGVNYKFCIFRRN
jgi:hypothetical protein